MVAHNEDKKIAVCLDSLLSQDYPEEKMEIIIVDDFSTDNSKKIIKKYIGKYKYIKLVTNNKKGLGSAIYNGIIKSKKKFLCIFMADMSDDLKDLKKYYLEVDRLHKI
jgi:glycosyltransferase involved in cell wall biosynthesis